MGMGDVTTYLLISSQTFLIHIHYITPAVDRMENIDTLIAPAIKVHRTIGEETRQFLIRSEMLDTSLRIQKVNDHIIFPLSTGVPECDRNNRLQALKSEHECIEYEFQPVQRKGNRDYRSLLSDIDDELQPFLPTSFDVIGDLCIVKLHDAVEHYSDTIASAIIESVRSIKGVYQDLGVTGEFRIRSLRHIGGVDRTITTHREFGMELKVDIDQVYFSPRLAGERYRIANLVRSSIQSHGQFERILDMFAGIGPCSICISRLNPNVEIHAIDVNPSAYELLVDNIKTNRTENIYPHLGDARELSTELAGDRKFQRIIMNLPHQSLEFFETALRSIDHGVIHVYSICHRDELPEQLQFIEKKVKLSERGLCGITTKELKGYSATVSYYSHDVEINLHNS